MVIDFTIVSLSPKWHNALFFLDYWRPLWTTFWTTFDYSGTNFRCIEDGVCGGVFFGAGRGEVGGEVVEEEKL